MNQHLKNLPIGTTTVLNGTSVKCTKSPADEACKHCLLLEKSKDCPQGDKYPLCFAQEREDKESVYYKPVKK